MIFRRYRQLEHLIQVSALIHYQQRVRVILFDRECVVAHPVGFGYARDLLGPGGVNGRIDARLEKIPKWMQQDAPYTSKDVAKQFDYHLDTARNILNDQISRLLEK